jgi:hypothetical protein
VFRVLDGPKRGRRASARDDRDQGRRGIRLPETRLSFRRGLRSRVCRRLDQPEAYHRAWKSSARRRVQTSFCWPAASPGCPVWGRSRGAGFVRCGRRVSRIPLYTTMVNLARYHGVRA